MANPPSNPALACSVSNGSGTATADVSTIEVSCTDILFEDTFEVP